MSSKTAPPSRTSSPSARRRAVGPGLTKRSLGFAALISANLGLVLVLTLGASLVSALLTLNKVRSAEPAELF